MSQRIDRQNAARPEIPWECPDCKAMVYGLTKCVCNPKLGSQVGYAPAQIFDK